MTFYSIDGNKLPDPVISIEGRRIAEANLQAAEAAYAAEPSLENTIWLGRRLAYLFRFDEAFDVYGFGIAEWPDAFELYRHRGHRYISTRQFELALADFEQAANLASDAEPIIEQDGIPNKLNQPTSNSHFNIYYHLGLTRYLLGNLDGAAAAYITCLEQFSDNADSVCATVDWLYMTYRRMGNATAAQSLLSRIDENMTLIESDSYHKRLLMYKGLRSPESLLDTSGEISPIDLATQGYGVGNWHLYNNDIAAAKAVFAQVLQTSNWSAFGFIAAEVDMYKMK